MNWVYQYNRRRMDAEETKAVRQQVELIVFGGAAEDEGNSAAAPTVVSEKWMAVRWSARRTATGDSAASVDGVVIVATAASPNITNSRPRGGDGRREDGV